MGWFAVAALEGAMIPLAAGVARRGTTGGEDTMSFSAIAGGATACPSLPSGRRFTSQRGGCRPIRYIPQPGRGRTASILF